MTPATRAPTDPDELLNRSMIVGHWITSFDLQFPESQAGDPPNSTPIVTFVPTAFLASYRFDVDGTMSMRQTRNKGGSVDVKARTGKFTIGWNREGFLGGNITVSTKGGGFVLHYLMRNRNELHWILDGPDALTPIAQGTMYRAELVNLLPTPPK